MKKVRRMLLFALMTVCLIAGSMSVMAKTELPPATKKVGWVQKGKNTYYRDKTGKLVKNREIEINKKTYLFDKKGRLVKGKVKSGSIVYYYSKKDGHYKYSYIDLKITKVEEGSVIGKNKKDAYRLDDSVKVYSKAGKKLAFGKLKKGQKVRVYFTGGILEVYPLQFAKVLKVKLL